MTPTIGGVFKRVLIANRGEIAVRVIHACRELGVQAAAVYSDADADAQHVRLADSAAHIGPAEAAQSYLDFERLLGAVRELGCDALHAGYGFLAENADFAQAVIDAGLAWIGPPPEAMRRMGLKVEARQVAKTAGATLVPGFEPEIETVVDSGAIDEAQSPDAFSGAANQLGYPVLVKASAGGGGKGMRLVRSDAELPESLAAARREAQSAFGNAAVYLEKYIDRPRHIEVQLLADDHGGVLALGERECSIQRRHQKLIEESPSVAITQEQRVELCATAVNVAREVGYVGAGTIEFIMTTAGEFYFLEMNTRLQVEHPVTELVYGLDIVQWQLRIAAGESITGIAGFGGDGRRARRPSSERSEPPKADVGRPEEYEDNTAEKGSMPRAATPVPPARGHAIEVRIVAEDPARGFLPQTGRIELLRVPQAPGVRFDHALREGLEISPYYDSLLGKLVVWHETRESSIARLQTALHELRILGVPTNITYLQDVLAHPAFQAGELHTGFIEEQMAGWQPPEADAVVLELAENLKKSTVVAAAALEETSGWSSLSGWSNT